MVSRAKIPVTPLKIEIGDYMEKDSAQAAIQPGLKSLKKSHVIETEFQPMLKGELGHAFLMPF